MAQPLSIKTANVARLLRPGLWEWTIFLAGPDEVLEQVSCVEYTLHRTFPDPVREVCDRGAERRAFALTARGWGTFEVGVRVFLRDGRIQELSHGLKF